MAPTTESRLNVDALSKKDVLLLFSVLEGELEARDLIIQALRDRVLEQSYLYVLAELSLSVHANSLQRTHLSKISPGATMPISLSELSKITASVNLLSFEQAQRRETYVWERYGKYDLSDPFLALQRDNEALRSSAQGGGNGASCSQRREPDNRRSNPLTMLRLVVGHCRRMQEKMLKQLAAAESRHRRVIADLEEEKRRHAEDTAEGDDVTCILEKERERLLQQLDFEKTKSSRMEKENKRLQAQLEDERVQHKQLMNALGRECKRSSLRAHEEGQRASELIHRLECQHVTNQSLKAELEKEKKCAMQMEARREELLAEFDTEREQLGLRLRREESCRSALQEEVERLRREVWQLRGQEDKEEQISEFREVRNGSVAVGTEKSNTIQLKINGHHTTVEEKRSGLRQRNEHGEENGASHSTLSPDRNELTCVSSSNLNNESAPICDTCSSPETMSSSSLQAAYQAGIQQRFHAARHKFQSVAEQDLQLSSPAPHSPRDLSPCATTDPPAECSNSKQVCRSTVTQALGRFSAKTAQTPNSSPFGTDFRALSPTGALSPGIRSPTIPRVDRGIPPPIPPKKPGLAETPPSPATLRAAHMAQLLAGCGRKSTENSKEPDLLLSSSS